MGLSLVSIAMQKETVDVPRCCGQRNQDTEKPNATTEKPLTMAAAA
jgi:hypothetical protein